MHLNKLSINMAYLVHFEPANVDIECEAGMTLVQAAHQAGVPIQAVCGGQGRCGKCQVKLISTPFPEPVELDLEIISPEALAKGYRLACRHEIDRDLIVECLPLSYSRRKEKGEWRPYESEKIIKRYALHLTPPSLERHLSDAENLLETLSVQAGEDYISIDREILQKMPTLLRQYNWKVVASCRDSEVIGISPFPKLEHSLGVAVDLGTTNIAVYLYDLDKEQQVDSIGATNPLITFGADIMSRLSLSQREAGTAARMNQILVKTVNLLVAHLTDGHGYRPEDIEEMVVVGNSGMHHIFCNLISRQLINAPYIPATRQALSIKARELGIRLSPGAYVYLPPLVGGFVGSDLIAVALTMRFDQDNGVRLAVDIGTNTELLLAVGDQLFSCSCASGPALEGAALRFGSLAVPGAIDRVFLGNVDGELAYHTIHNKPALGICGSGIFDALAVLVETGVINSYGRLQVGNDRVKDSPIGNREYVIAPASNTVLGTDLTISQQDIREIQLGKGAIRGGIETLLREQKVKPEDIDEILIAGAFGNYIRIESAMEIGLFPSIAPSRIRQIGNAAGVGAGLILLSSNERKKAEELSKRINYIELSIHPQFKRFFVESQLFPLSGCK
jgi:uncharacterized 2Fe-2S/4Fe-4S cluster protein (DUF4445 family)